MQRRGGAGNKTLPGSLSKRCVSCWDQRKRSDQNTHKDQIQTTEWRKNNPALQFNADEDQSRKGGAESPI